MAFERAGMIAPEEDSADRRGGTTPTSTELSRPAFVRLLEESGLVAVIRVSESVDLVGIARALSRGGIRFIEITMTVPNPFEAIRAAVGEVGDQMVIGAGTVLDAATARSAIEAGAAFLVSPVLDIDVLETAHEYGRAAIPGALTPTEIVAAWRAGADVVKVFPGRVATPGYFADLKGPLPQVRMMPTGNVDLTTAAQYLRAGAIALGVGKALVDPSAVRHGDLGILTENARAFRKLVDAARVGPA